MVSTPRHFLLKRDFLAVSISHFFIDVLNSSRSLLMAILAVSLGMTNTQVGIVLILYNVGNALSQPLFGMLADRIGPRWPVVGGVGWMIAFYTLASLAPDQLAVIALTFAGLGSGAFHPSGTMVASIASHTHRTQATSVFFMAGQLGLFTGPVLAGLLLQYIGRSGYVVLPLLATIAFASAWQWMKTEWHPEVRPRKTAGATRNLIPHFRERSILLSTVIFCLGTVTLAAINYGPILFTELGYTAVYVGLLTGLLMLGSAVGGLVGGSLADRWGGLNIVVIASLASILPAYFYLSSDGAARFLLMPLAGFFLGMPHSILVLSVQNLLPGRRATASGVALGFMFFSGTVGSFFVGLAADQIGLARALQLTALLPLIAAIATLALRWFRNDAVPVPEG